MSKNRIAALIAACLAAGAGLSAARAETAPCEDMLNDLRAAKAAATLSQDVQAQVEALEAKGVERCNADDDRRADDFFAQAMKAMGK